ncbi:Claudin-7 [Liparis tanakae]|uniref:Claudin-7 n=1 Tax=Liparis tanakae TaxID=230148 RepID=A0A4Z2ES17_9TELE|nr:Claudin-7 [Liparis tanakae]
MAVGLQVAGLLLGLVSWCLQSSCTSSQVWKLRSQQQSLSSTAQFQGLWMSCVATATGSLQCSRFRTVLGLPAHLQACRALMVLSLLVGLASVVLSVLGLRCVHIGRTPERRKDQIALSGGVLFILSGVFTLTAVSWFAARVIQDFYDPLYGGVRSVWGPSGVLLGSFWGPSGFFRVLLGSFWGPSGSFWGPSGVLLGPSGVLLGSFWVLLGPSGSFWVLLGPSGFELGAGLYLGWAAGATAVLGGGLLCCSYGEAASAPPARHFSYNFSSTTEGPKVYRAAPASGGGGRAYV